jgi:hypothetical protein
MIDNHRIVIFIYNSFSSSDGIEYLRIIRDPTPNQYMCLIKFKSQVRTKKIGVIHRNVC